MEQELLSDLVQPKITQLDEAEIIEILEMELAVVIKQPYRKIFCWNCRGLGAARQFSSSVV